MTRGTAAVVVRAAVQADEPFLWRMLSLAAALLPATPPHVEAARRDPALAPYLVGWGRPGDAGVVAEVAGDRVGAAWYRRFAAAMPGYGFVSEEIPEVSLAVEAAWRGRGIGRGLMRALMDRATADGIEALSLSVDASNAPALTLYESIGFRTVGGDAGHPTMLLDLGPA